MSHIPKKKIICEGRPPSHFQNLWNLLGGIGLWHVHVVRNDIRFIQFVWLDEQLCNKMWVPMQDYGG